VDKVRPGVSGIKDAREAIARAKRLAREAEAERAGQSTPLGISTHKRTETPLKLTKGDSNGSAAGRKAMGVDLYPEGVRVQAMDIPGNPTGKGGGNIRGTIKGWSSASRRRMREFMLSHGLGEGYHCAGLTLTIPGPGFDGEGIRRLWQGFSVRWRRAGGCAVWRREVQARGTDHWHCLAGLSGDRETVEERSRAEWLGTLQGLGSIDFGAFHVRAARMGGEMPPDVQGHTQGLAGISEGTGTGLGDWGCVGVVGTPERAKDGDWWVVPVKHWGGSRDVRMRSCKAVAEGEAVVLSGDIAHVRLPGKRGDSYWAELIENVRRVDGLPGWSEGWTGTAVRGYPDLSKWPGAEVRACKAELQEKSGAWLRYLQDHATKAKQAQILKPGAGRHWGKIQAKGFVVSAPTGRVDFGDDHKAMGRFLRQLDRLRSPRCRAAKHDGKRRYSVRSSRTGGRVYFSRPETVKRLAEWAVSPESSVPVDANRVPCGRRVPPVGEVPAAGPVWPFKRP